MIISASRRTDIPAFHSEWMMNRLRAGYVCVRNPFNARQVSRVSLSRSVAEAIVFWTKNAWNMLKHLPEIDDMGLKYLFQYTLTPYGEEIERQVDKRQALDAMMKLSEKIGKDRVIWRYDPILLGNGWTADRHVRMFEKMAGRLRGASDRCVISFVDLYAGLKKRAPWIEAPSEEEMRMMAREISGIARKHGMMISACAEILDFSGEGIEARGCIDPEDVGRLLNAQVSVKKDSGQRSACRCLPSVDIGAYDTCGHDCLYCYAHTRRGTSFVPDVGSEALDGAVEKEDRVTERKNQRIALRDGEQTTFL